MTCYTSGNPHDIIHFLLWRLWHLTLALWKSKVELHGLGECCRDFCTCLWVMMMIDDDDDGDDDDDDDDDDDQGRVRTKDRNGPLKLNSWFLFSFVHCLLQQSLNSLKKLMSMIFSKWFHPIFFAAYIPSFPAPRIPAMATLTPMPMFCSWTPWSWRNCNVVWSALEEAKTPDWTRVGNIIIIESLNRVLIGYNWLY